MNRPFEQHGAFSWCELMTTDVAAAKTFYQQVFGWEMKDQVVNGIPYTVVQAGGEQIGGLMGMPPDAAGMPPSWGTYVTVDDVKSTADQVEQLGGKILIEPRDIPDVGQFTLIQDPQGAVISAISYSPADCA